MVQFVQENFVPVRVHVREQADEFKRLAARYGERWTPTILVLDPEGVARHKVEGFLPAEELVAQLALGLAHSAFARERFEEAERRFREIVERYPGSAAAPEALYWAGVARYKATSDVAALADTARRLRERYGDSTWATKASVWAT